MMKRISSLRNGNPAAPPPPPCGHTVSAAGGAALRTGGKSPSLQSC